MVKRALNSRAVEPGPLAAARALIRREAQAGVEAARRFVPRRHDECRVELQFNGTAHAEVAEGLPGLERPTPDTVAFTARSMPEAYRMIRLLSRYLNPN